MKKELLVGIIPGFILNIMSKKQAICKMKNS